MSNDEVMQERYRKIGLTLPSKTEAVSRAGSKWRRYIQFVLHQEIPLATGAVFYTPFFIHTEEAHRDFWLIHLSGHYRARDVMVGLHWDQSTDFSHYGKAGFNMLGYDQSNDLHWTLQSTLPTFQFDATAKEKSQRELLSQLPDLLSTYRDGIRFDTFFSTITNRCPVTQDIMKEVLDKLANEEVIVVRDTSGKKRKRRKIGRRDDVLSLHSQMRIPFG
jgi:hypothetical protein